MQINKQLLNKEKIFELSAQFMISQCLFTAVEFNLFDVLSDGAMSSDALANATGTHPEALYRLLQILVSYDFVTETEPDCFQLTDLGRCLTSDGDSSFHNIVKFMEHQSSFWRELSYSLRTGDSAFVYLYGMKPYQYIKQNPELAKTFDLAMQEISDMFNTSILAAYDFSGAKKVVDVGGGTGVMLVKLLRQYPEAKGIVFDQQHVAQRAEKFIEQSGLNNRCRAVGGSFLESVPAGGDIYIIQNTLNDWDDENAALILQNCRAVMAEGGRVLAVQRIMTPTAPHSTRMVNLQKLMTRSLAGGRVRTDAEMQSLYETAGLQMNRILETSSDISIVEGIAQ